MPHIQLTCFILYLCYCLAKCNTQSLELVYQQNCFLINHGWMAPLFFIFIELSYFDINYSQFCDSKMSKRGKYVESLEHIILSYYRLQENRNHLLYELYKMKELS